MAPALPSARTSEGMQTNQKLNKLRRLQHEADACRQPVEARNNYGFQLRFNLKKCAPGSAHAPVSSCVVSRDQPASNSPGLAAPT